MTERVRHRFLLRLATATAAPACAAAAVLVTAVATLIVSNPLQAQDRPSGVTLTGVYSTGQRVAIMVLPVGGAAGDSIKTILERDLDYSDRFQHVPAISAPAEGQPLNYALIARAGAAAVVQAKLLPSGWLRVMLHDVAGKKIMNQADLPLDTKVNTDGWRLGVHSVSDQIEQWITGEKGVAATRIAFTRDDRIWVVDSDGAGARAVTPRGMSPSWHPSGRYIAYHVIDVDRHRLVITDVVTGAQRSLTNEKGALDNSPAISPDGRSVVFSRSVEATASSTDLFVMPFDGGRPTRISVARGSINGAPSWSIDGRRVAFNSDRSGRSEIYIADADGTNASLLSADAFGERNLRTDPSWSPDGRMLAYASMVGGSMQILTINLRDRTVRQLTSDGNNKSPSWAPDGRHIVFSSNRGGTEQLWVVDVESGRTRQLVRGGSVSRLADWSPRLSNTP